METQQSDSEEFVREMRFGIVYSEVMTVTKAAGRGMKLPIRAVACGRLGLSRVWMGLFVVLVCSCAGFGGEPGREAFPYRIDQWKSEQGLPQNTVRYVLQTRDGYLWIATSAGLARFDGLRFTVYHRANTPAMVEDNCVVLAEDRDGALWIGTENGLLRWQNQRFTAWSAGPTNTPTAPAHRQIRALCPSRQGGVWIGTGGGLDFYRDGKFIHYTTADGLQANNIRAVLEDKEGNVWVGTEMHQFFGGLQRREVGGRRFGTVSGQGTNLAYMVHNLFENDEGVWWGNNAGLHCVSNGVIRDFHMADGLSGEVVGRMARASGRGIWMVVGERVEIRGHRGLCQMKQGRIAQLDVAAWGIDTELIGVLEDLEGSIWLNTRYDGLYRLQPRRVQGFGRRDGLAHDVVNGICEGFHGSIWVGTERGLSEIRHGRVLALPSTVVGDEKVISLIGDGRGWIWMSTDQLVMRALVGGELAPIRQAKGLIVGFPLTCLAKEAEGHLWCGFSNGVSRITVEVTSRDEVFCRRQYLDRKDGLPSAEVRAIVCSQHGLGPIWVGTYGGGLCCLRGVVTNGPGSASEMAGKEIDTVSPLVLASTPRTYTARDGLCSDFIRTLHEDQEGVLWIGTDAGLSRLKGDRFSSIGLRQGLSDDQVSQILEDDFGQFWLGGNRGITRVSGEDLNAVAEGRLAKLSPVFFGEADGLPSCETRGLYQPAACKSRDGRLWFSTLKGVAVVDPKAIKLNEVPPPVVIEEVLVNDDVVFGRRVGDDLGGTESSSRNRGKSEVVDLKSGIRIAPGGGRLMEIRYTANSFLAPEKVRFKYRLEGHDPEWRSDDQNRRVAFYTNLRPGEYRFHVTACNNHGVWNELGDSFTFRLAPHFYETWTFYLLCVVGVMLVGLGLHRFRVRFLSRIQLLEHQLAMDRERARIARDIHDDLGSRLSQLSVLGELAERNLEGKAKARPHLEKLQGTTRDVFQTLDEIVWAVNPKQDSVSGLVSYLREFGPEFLGGAGIHCRLDFPSPVPERPLQAEVRHHLFLVIKEALNNVLKHAQATEVRLRLAVEDDVLLLGIEDNGRGFNGAHMLSAGDTPQSSMGNGLMNMRQRLAQLGGQFHLDSQPGHGTRILLRLAL